MQIKDFNLKFTSASERGNLFQGLRNLSLVDDLKSMFSQEEDGSNGPVFAGWDPWPPVGVDAACEA